MATGLALLHKANTEGHGGHIGRRCPVEGNVVAVEGGRVSNGGLWGYKKKKRANCKW